MLYTHLPKRVCIWIFSFIFLYLYAFICYAFYVILYMIAHRDTKHTNHRILRLKMEFLPPPPLLRHWATAHEVPKPKKKTCTPMPKTPEPDVTNMETRGVKCGTRRQPRNINSPHAAHNDVSHWVDRCCCCGPHACLHIGVQMGSAYVRHTFAPIFRAHSKRTILNAPKALIHFF